MFVLNIHSVNSLGIVNKSMELQARTSLTQILLKSDTASSTILKPYNQTWFLNVLFMSTQPPPP